MSQSNTNCPQTETNSSSGPVRVLCLGGGYVALYLTKGLRRETRAGRIELTIVDRNNFHTFHGLVPEMLAGKIQANNVLSGASQIFRDATFYTAKVQTLDHPNRRVTISRSLDGREFELEYDELVMAVGSDDDLSRYPGLKEHTFRLKSYADCFRVRNHIISMLELAHIENDPEERRRLLTFVVAGGNYAGVEVAAELSEHLPKVINKHFSSIDIAECSLHLVHSGDRILPELGSRFPKLVEHAERALGKRHLKFRLGLRLQSATEEEAILSDGSRIPTRTIISCTGSAISPLLGEIGAPQDERGRLRLKNTLEVQGVENVWSGGDCGAVPMQNGENAPPLAIYAMTAGSQIARNIRAKTQNKKLKAYTFTGLGDACVLGTGEAVAHLKGIELKGWFAWLIWRAFMIIYLPAPERKLRVLMDWLLCPIFGRDLTDLKVSSPIGIREARYEAGQPIIREGEIGHCLYLVQEGEVEVTRSTPTGPEHLATLGKGAHFGERSIFQRSRRNATVVAKTPTRVLTVQQETAQALGQTLESLGEKFSRLPESNNRSS